MMWDALMIGTGFVAGVAGTVALAVRWYERPQDWCGGTDGSVYLAGYQHGRRDGATVPRNDTADAMALLLAYPRAPRTLSGLDMAKPGADTTVEAAWRDGKIKAMRTR